VIRALSVRTLLIAIGMAVFLTICSLLFADHSVAQFVSKLPWASKLQQPALGLPILVLLSCVTIVAAALQSATGRPVSSVMQVLVVASFSLVWSVCVDEFILKTIFGRETPDQFLQTGVDAFHWFKGQPTSSFPSGHAVQIMAIGVVLAMAYPRRRIIWFVLMGIGLLALVLGNWHFASDVIAGAAFGALGGVATFGLWRRSNMGAT